MLQPRSIARKRNLGAMRTCSFALLPTARVSFEEDEAIILSARTGRLYALDDAGTIVLRAYMSGATVAQAAIVLSEVFGISLEEATGDACEFASDLIKHGVMRYAEMA